jgi:hypothetical protein
VFLIIFGWRAVGLVTARTRREVTWKLHSYCAVLAYLSNSSGLDYSTELMNYFKSCTKHITPAPACASLFSLHVPPRVSFLWHAHFWAIGPHTKFHICTKQIAKARKSFFSLRVSSPGLVLLLATGPRTRVGGGRMTWVAVISFWV